MKTRNVLTKTLKGSVLALLTATSLIGLSARAEDIDIYGAGAANGPKPNIVIVFDNASRNNSNFTGSCVDNTGTTVFTLSTLQDATRCALYIAIQDIGTQASLLGKFNMGMLVYGNGSNQGGQWIIPSITAGSKSVSTPLVTMDANGISTFLTALTPPIGTANNASVSGGMQEAWAFFTGSQAANTEVFGSYTTYASHETISCQKSFIIMVGAATGNNGEPETGNTGGVGGASGLANAGATAAQQVQINTSSLGPNTGDDSAWGDEWSRFLYQTDFSGSQNGAQNIITYTIAAGGTRPNYVQFLHSMADQGGGKAFVASDVNSMVQAFLQIFNEVQAVNSVFASSSLPISSNTQGTYQNQVFIGMFRPDGSANPRWMGNLKQYQFGVDTTNPSNPTLFLADSKGVDAINGTTGFITPLAVSFWNPVIDTSKLPDSIGGFWVNNPQGAGGGYDNPDGEIVEKGGVGQQIRLANLQDNYTTNPIGPRNVFTCTLSSGSCASATLTQFATTNSNLNSAAFSITAPSTTISSFARSGTTVTVTLGSAPSPALTNGQSVTIQGASSTELNGTFSVSLLTPTTFTYTIQEDPPSPSTGTYTATSPASAFTITSLTRSGTTVTATTSVPHSYIAGNSVTIAGANGSRYNGTFTIASVPTSSTFTYTITDSPSAATTGGTADLGTTHTNGITFTSSKITRDATHTDNTSIVTITLSSGTLNGAYAVNAKVNVSNVTPSGYNVTLAPIIGVGAPGTGGCPSGTKNKSFCYSIATTPASPDIGGTPTVGTPAKSVAISAMTHSVACTGSTPTNATTVTATTATTNPFNVGDSASIAGNPVGAGESAYVGTFTVTSSATSSFAFSTTTSPPCAPNAAGASAITSTTGVDVNSLINWVRGDDNVGDEPSPGNGITIRPSVHGDVLHSRPAVVNYGGSIGVVVFYGANDGTFRAINGNQPGGPTIGSATPGGEIWSFVAPEFYSELPRLYLNSPSIKLATTPDGITPTPQPKNYFFDGSTGVYQDSSHVYIFLSARRGGRFIEAFDVTDPTNPKFMWKRSNSDFSELGYTWSLPKPARVRGWPNPIVIFGGGYDPNEDSEPPATDTMGRGIFILDATTGNLVWSATYGAGATGTCTGTCTLSDMTYAIPADVTLVNRDFDQAGYIDRLYAADLGGNIWRVDLEPAGYTADPSLVGPSTWQITKFAALGGSGPTPRKFFYPPDIVATKTFDMILAGTGDREHPLYSSNTTQSYSIVNRFYGLKDVNTGSSVPAGWSNSGSTPGSNAPIVDGTSSTADNAVTGLTTVTSSTTYNPATSNNGFYFTFPNAGEKAVNAPTTVGGFTYIGTNTPQVPSSNACSTLGVARGYQFNFLTGASAFTIFINGGLPPSPVAGLVNVPVDGVDRLVPFCLGCGNPAGGGPDSTSSIGGGRPPIPVPPVRKRLYWYLQNHDN